MLKTEKNIRQKEKAPFVRPLRTRDLIPVDRVGESGIFRLHSLYSRTYALKDINYCVASHSDKRSILEKYMGFLNSLQDGNYAKVTICNHRFSETSVDRLLLSQRGDGLDEYRSEYNDMLREKARGTNGIIQEKYLTVSSFDPDSEAEADAHFARLDQDLQSSIRPTGSSLTPLTLEERFRLLHHYLQPDTDFVFDPPRSRRLGHDLLDLLAPDNAEIHKDYLMLGSRYVRVFYLKDYANHIRDTFIPDMTALATNLVLSIDILPIPIAEAQKEIEKILLGVETNITNWQRKQNKNNNFSAIVPYDMELQRQESKQFLDQLAAQDEKMMLCCMTLAIFCDSFEQLQEDTRTILSVAQRHMCQMAPLTFQQTDGLQTVLPFGLQKIKAYRTLTTRSLAIFTPFKVQEILDEDGIYYGQNAISNNLILCDKKRLLNQSSFILGVPGSGKSFLTKEIIAFLMLNTEDDILICDPEGEYSALVEAMGKAGQVISLSAQGQDRLNAMEMTEGYDENEMASIATKSQFVLSLFHRVNRSMSAVDCSLVDRAVRDVYEERDRVVPTLTGLCEKLKSYPEKNAKELALSMELYTTGSLGIFGGESNVNLSRRITSFDISKLGEQLKPTGLLVITDTMLNRVAFNSRNGKRTHIFIDEFHVVFENKESALFFASAWKQFRKRNAFPTAITQNVTYLLSAPEATTMLSNSEFIVMLNQAPTDQQKLSELLHISKEQLSYIDGAKSGCGLIKYGSVLVPFKNEFPAGTRLYQLMTTKPGEWQGGKEKIRGRNKGVQPGTAKRVSAKKPAPAAATQVSS